MEIRYTCGYRKHWHTPSVAADAFEQVWDGVKCGRVMKVDVWESGRVLVVDDMAVAMRLPGNFDRAAFCRRLTLHGIKQVSNLQTPYRGKTQVFQDSQFVGGRLFFNRASALLISIAHSVSRKQPVV